MGKVFRFNKDVDTDQIIASQYLLYPPVDEMKAHTFESLDADFASNVRPGDFVVADSNFGCGSSREHAPWVLEYNNINLVIAVNFARIFRQNMFNCGLMAVSLPEETIDEIFKTFAGTDAECTTDVEKSTFTISNGKTSKVYPFKVGAFDLELVKAGGWVDYADSKY